MRRDTKLALIAVLLTAGVAGLAAFTIWGLVGKGRTERPANTAAEEPALTDALRAYREGRLEAALEAARRAAQSAQPASRRSARLVEARALTDLGEATAAAQAWDAILNGAGYTQDERAEAAVRMAELRQGGEPPDPAAAIAELRDAVSRFPGTTWGDQAAVRLADVYIADKHPELAEAALEAYQVQAKDPELIQAKIGDVNMAILFSPLITEVPKCIKYTVQSGDSLAKIAKDFDTTVDLLQESNRIDDPRLLQVGDRIKVVTDTFRIVVDKSENTLSLFCHDKLMKKYRVGTGEYDKTPVGDFKIVSKEVDPAWRGLPHDDPGNILGTRWMKITDEEGKLSGYGIHGTTLPETIGTYESQGCIRLLNRDVEEIFKIVTYGTPVSIVE